MKPKLTDLQLCVLLAIRDNPGIRAGRLVTSWRVVCSLRAVPPRMRGKDRARRAVASALRALQRAGLIQNGWHPTAKARGAP